MNWQPSVFCLRGLDCRRSLLRGLDFLLFVAEAFCLQYELAAFFFLYVAQPVV